MSKKKSQGFVSETEKFKIEVKYSDEAVEKELIKFTPKKGKSVEINADAIIGIIATQFKTKDFALALADTEINNVFVVETERYINATLDRDFKKGETISFPFKHIYPYVLAAVEETYKICKMTGQVESVPKEVYEETLKKLGDINKEFIEKYYKKEITSN